MDGTDAKLLACALPTILAMAIGTLLAATTDILGVWLVSFGIGLGMSMLAGFVLGAIAVYKTLIGGKT